MSGRGPLSRRSVLGALAAGALAPLARAQQRLPIFDAHVHYSHDAWELVPPKEAIAILRKAGLRARSSRPRATRARSSCWPRRPT